MELSPGPVRTQVFRLETWLANFTRHFIFVLSPHRLRLTNSLLYPMSFKTYGHWTVKTYLLLCSGHPKAVSLLF